MDDEDCSMIWCPSCGEIFSKGSVHRCGGSGNDDGREERLKRLIDRRDQELANQDRSLGRGIPTNPAFSDSSNLGDDSDGVGSDPIRELTPEERIQELTLELEEKVRILESNALQIGELNKRVDELEWGRRGKQLTPFIHPENLKRKACAIDRNEYMRNYMAKKRREDKLKASPYETDI